MLDQTLFKCFIIIVITYSKNAHLNFPLLIPKQLCTEIPACVCLYIHRCAWLYRYACICTQGKSVFRFLECKISSLVIQILIMTNHGCASRLSQIDSLVITVWYSPLYWLSVDDMAVVIYNNIIIEDDHIIGESEIVLLSALSVLCQESDWFW